ncbi:hypothetical protein BASA61_009767 [Batrachochytrium salamandrivorans]|nr:hypothetical protein BASA62_009975 [Batrachochytrium salamandrivorans]KAH6580211.1 hypothetical protein BASA61_009767 [Batrachochytrium salamandrivorans]KAH9270853.1 hypothetical protein BASA83_007006 [Batrachochytrium salamandrivorans]
MQSDHPAFTELQQEAKRLQSAAADLLLTLHALEPSIHDTTEPISTHSQKQHAPHQHLQQQLVKSKQKRSCPQINGTQKCASLIKAELAFLTTLLANPDRIRTAHVRCSNIPYLTSVVQSLHLEPSVIGVFKVFKYTKEVDASRSCSGSSDRIALVDLDQANMSSVRVDVVACNGLRWIKVKTSNMKGKLENFELTDSSDDADHSDTNDNRDKNESINDDRDTAENDNVQTSHSAESNHHLELNPDSTFDAALGALHLHTNQTLEQTGPDQLNTKPLVLRRKLPLIVCQALELLEAAKQNHVHYTSPTVVIKFLGSTLSDPKNDRIATMLRELGVVVEFTLLQETATSAHTISQPVSQPSLQSHQSAVSAYTTGENSKAYETTCPDNINRFPILRDPTITATNLPFLTPVLSMDVPTLLTLVSDTTHRFSEIRALGVYDNHVFLRDQAQNELATPIFPVLRQVLSHHDLVVTQAALDKFAAIVMVIGGQREKARARRLFQTCDVVDALFTSEGGSGSGAVDDVRDTLDAEKDILSGALIRVVPNTPSDRFVALMKKTPRFGAHNINIFGTGDQQRITTITANASVGRSLAEAGFGNVALWVHSPRSLIETRVLKWLKSQHTGE